jgi:cyanophycinase-like exopeptidase
MPVRPWQPLRIRPVLEVLEDRLPVTNLLSLRLPFLDSGLPPSDQSSAAAPVESSSTARDLDLVLDDPAASSPSGFAPLGGVDPPAAAGSIAPSAGSGAGDGAAVRLSPAPADVAGPVTSTGALSYLGALAAAGAAPARPTALTSTGPVATAYVTPSAGRGAGLASAQRTAQAIDGGSPTPGAAAAKPSGSKVPSTRSSGKGYTYFRYGTQTDITTTSTPGLGLEGGGTDIDAFYQWMGARAHGGDFLVLGATKDDAYDSYIYGLNQAAGTPLNSVSTLDISSSAATTDPASAPFVTGRINEAAAIFIMGGDQSNYVNLWQTPLSSGAPNPIQQALDQAAARRVPIGGTSAGLAVLGQYVYSAEGTSAVSSTVLANPYDSSITLDQNFLSVANVSPSQPVPEQQALPYLENTITDPHFFERDRMGRLVTFLARLVADPQWTPPSPGGGPTPLPGTKGIGIDQSTALLIDPSTGIGTVIGNSPTNHLYFLQTSGVEPVGTPTGSGTLTLNAPLSWGGAAGNAILVHRATVGDTFDMRTWQPVSNAGGTDYQLSAAGGTLTSTQPGGSIY